MSKSKVKKAKKAKNDIQQKDIEIKTAPQQSSMNDSFHLNQINIKTPINDTDLRIDKQYSALMPSTRLLMEKT